MSDKNSRHFCKGEVTSPQSDCALIMGWETQPLQDWDNN